MQYPFWANFIQCNLWRFIQKWHESIVRLFFLLLSSTFLKWMLSVTIHPLNNVDYFIFLLLRIKLLIFVYKYLCENKLNVQEYNCWFV